MPHSKAPGDGVVETMKTFLLLTNLRRSLAEREQLLFYSVSAREAPRLEVRIFQRWAPLASPSIASLWTPHGVNSTAASGKPDFLQVSSGLLRHMSQERKSREEAVWPGGVLASDITGVISATPSGWKQSQAPTKSQEQRTEPHFCEACHSHC